MVHSHSCSSPSRNLPAWREIWRDSSRPGACCSSRNNAMMLKICAYNPLHIFPFRIFQIFRHIQIIYDNFRYDIHVLSFLAQFAHWGQHHNQNLWPRYAKAVWFGENRPTAVLSVLFGPGLRQNLRCQVMRQLRLRPSMDEEEIDLERLRTWTMISYDFKVSNDSNDSNAR